MPDAATKDQGVAEELLNHPKEMNMSIATSLTGAFLIIIVLWEAFETVIFPRRVTRRLRMARIFYRLTWPA